ncbi:MAG: HAMP domain-containing sensor histidine kinase [Pseudomonadota bacterium]|nr:HAMP domain-containing sensor histidine kinase [Pseudomonadota bacterium]
MLSHSLPQATHKNGSLLTHKNKLYQISEHNCHLGIGYAVVNQDLMIIANNLALAQWSQLEQGDLTGLWLDEVFPELLSCIDILQQLLCGQLNAPIMMVAVERISPDQVKRYFKLQIEPYVQTRTLLVTTIETTLEQQLQHQIQSYQQTEQDLQLYTNKLHKTNKLLAFSLHTKTELLTALNEQLPLPFNQVLGIVNTLLGEVYGAFNEQQKQALLTVEHNSYQLLTIVKHILELNNMNTQKLTLEMTPTLIKQTSEDCLQLIKQAAENKQLTIMTHFYNLQTIRQLDRRYLRRILLHLLSNAVKFTPAGGHIGLRIEDDPKLNWVYLIVWDTGVGIESAHLQTLLELDPHHLRKQNHWGLSLVHHFITQIGGTLKVDSQPGQGSWFTVALPTLTQHN